MTLSQLRTFVMVVQTGSVHAAAARLFVTQSAVSAAVSALQRDLGVELVARQGRGLRITPAGEAFAAHATTIVGLAEEAREVARGGVEPQRGRVRIGATTTVAEYVLPAFLASFRRRYPEADLQVEVGNRERLWTLLHQHAVDVAFAGRPPEDADLAVRSTRENSLVVVASPEVASNASVAEPGQMTWLLREEGSGTRATTQDYLSDSGVTPPTMTLGSNGAVVAGAEMGLGVTLVSGDAVRRELAEQRLVVLPLARTPLERPWHVVSHHNPTATADLFVAHLHETDPPSGTPPFRP
ncbi:MAG: LysR family transcriptional regulator [Euzebya sp.]